VSGYRTAPGGEDEAQSFFLPAGLTATAAAANAEYLRQFATYRPVLQRTRGNGCGQWIEYA
jgi:hypothetical protein